MYSIKANWAWCYASAMAVLTAMAEGVDTIEPDRLVWVLGFAGALFGAAFFPSRDPYRTGVKMAFGWIISVVASTPLALSHYLPAFVNVHVAALWLGFSGPAIFIASSQGSSLLTKFSKGATQ